MYTIHYLTVSMCHMSMCQMSMYHMSMYRMSLYFDLNIPTMTHLQICNDHCVGVG